MSHIFNLKKCSQIAETIADRELNQLGITSRQFAVLDSVAKIGTSKQVDITAATGIDRSTVTDLCRRLARSGFISRIRDRSDCRCFAIKLTQSGTDIHRVSERLMLTANKKASAAINGLDGLKIVERRSNVPAE